MLMHSFKVAGLLEKKHYISKHCATEMILKNESWHLHTRIIHAENKIKYIYIKLRK